MVQDFFPKNQHAQKKKKSTNELRFIEKYQNRTLKVDFLCQKLSAIFEIPQPNRCPKKQDFWLRINILEGKKNSVDE